MKYLAFDGKVFDNELLGWLNLLVESLGFLIGSIPIQLI